MYKEISEAPLVDSLCLATLIASGELTPFATLQDSRRYFERIVTCDQCPQVDNCLAVIIEA